MTSAGYGSLARIKHRADRLAAFLGDETRPCSRLDQGRRCPGASFRSPQRFAWRPRSRLCTGNRSCSRLLIAEWELELRSSNSNRFVRRLRHGNSGQSTGNFAQKWIPLPSPLRHSTSRRRSRTEPGRPVRRGSTGDVRWIESCFDCAEVRSESPDCFWTAQTVSLRRSVQICVTEGLLHVLFRERLAVDFDIRVNEEI
jgi:hypothetical protein